MIDLSKFSKEAADQFFGDGFPEEQLQKEMSCVPNWIPQQFWDLWRQFSDVTIGSTMFLSPAPYGAYINAIEGFSSQFKEYSLGGPQNVFPVAYSDAVEWGIFEKRSDGTVVCGMYDFESDEYFRGPFDSFEEWIYSYAE